VAFSAPRARARVCVCVSVSLSLSLGWFYFEKSEEVTEDAAGAERRLCSQAQIELGSEGAMLSHQVL
jgi:hypothetical protein